MLKTVEARPAVTRRGALDCVAVGTAHASENSDFLRFSKHFGRCSLTIWGAR